MPTTKEAEMHVNLPESLDPVVPASPGTLSTTAREVSSEVRATIWAVSYANLIDDIAIAAEVRRRDAADSGNRVKLEDFMRQEGYDPAAFGLE